MILLFKMFCSVKYNLCLTSCQTMGMEQLEDKTPLTVGTQACNVSLI